ncbi:hypothetical protein WA158_004203 [Blastocystis sp. Blastoise]
MSCLPPIREDGRSSKDCCCICCVNDGTVKSFGCKHKICSTCLAKFHQEDFSMDCPLCDKRDRCFQEDNEQRCQGPSFSCIRSRLMREKSRLWQSLPNISKIQEYGNHYRQDFCKNATYLAKVIPCCSNKKKRTDIVDTCCSEMDFSCNPNYDCELSNTGEGVAEPSDLCGSIQFPSDTNDNKAIPLHCRQYLPNMCKESSICSTSTMCPPIGTNPFMVHTKPDSSIRCTSDQSLNKHSLFPPTEMNLAPINPSLPSISRPSCPMFPSSTIHLYSSPNNSISPPSSSTNLTTSSTTNNNNSSSSILNSPSSSLLHPQSFNTLKQEDNDALPKELMDLTPINNYDIKEEDPYTLDSAYPSESNNPFSFDSSRPPLPSIVPSYSPPSLPSPDYINLPNNASSQPIQFENQRTNRFNDTYNNNGNNQILCNFPENAKSFPGYSSYNNLKCDDNTDSDSSSEEDTNFVHCLIEGDMDSYINNTPDKPKSFRGLTRSGHWSCEKINYLRRSCTLSPEENDNEENNGNEKEEEDGDMMNINIHANNSIYKTPKHEGCYDTIIPLNSNTEGRCLFDHHRTCNADNKQDSQDMYGVSKLQTIPSLNSNGSTSSTSSNHSRDASFMDNGSDNENDTSNSVSAPCIPLFCQSKASNGRRNGGLVRKSTRCESTSAGHVTFPSYDITPMYGEDCYKKENNTSDCHSYTNVTTPFE